ncbi:MAG: hypothetical protein LBG30_01190 [Odoribacteraceae bacterium]|jgi:hypothetical protein|nr:hypothetical protein [Odoribacteraceae bacterium]
MKNKITAALLIMLAACYEDKGNYAYKDYPPIDVSGILQSYTAYSRETTLSIQPVIPNHQQYDYVWELYNTAFNVNLRVIPRPDTLALAKDLSYPVKENPGNYLLVLRVTDRQTGYTEIKTAPLTIATTNMRGWYLLKDNGAYTDLDFYPENETGAISATPRRDWLSFFNNGRQLAGKAIKAIFVPKFRMTPASDELNALAIASDSDVAIARVDNGEIIRDFSNSFFAEPAARDVRNLLLDVSESSIYLINDGLIYIMNKVGGMFVDPPVGNYRASGRAAVSFSPLILFHDQLSNSLVRFGNNAYSPYNDANTPVKVNNLDAEPLWMEGYNYPRWRINALLRRHSDSQVIFTSIANDYGGSTSLAGSSRVIPSSLGLANADVWGGNFTYEIIYFARDNFLYRANMDADPPGETLQVTFPEGETVTCIQHLVKPVPQSGSTVAKDFIAVATHADGRYKVYLYTTEVGNLLSLPSPTFEGNGRVTCVNYVQPDGGLRVF